ncbi:hypothetical protein V1504DRAFT_470415 [Lipomyces starkeyi]
MGNTTKFGILTQRHTLFGMLDSHPQFFESKVSCIQIGMYLSNWLKQPLFMPRKESDGTFNFFVGVPVDAPLPMIATEEDTGPLVKALVDAPHTRQLIAYRELMNMEEFVKTWSRIVGVKARTTVWTFEDIVKAIGPEFGPEFAEAMAYAAEFGYEARKDPDIVHPRDSIVGNSGGQLKIGFQNQDWSGLLNQ